MASSYTEMQQWETNGINQSSGFASSTNQNSIQLQALAGPLAAPQGWRSQIIDSNSPIPIDTTNNEYYSNYNAGNNYNDQYTTHTYNTSQINQVPARFARNVNEYRSRSVDDSSYYQQQMMLSEHDQHNLVQRVERQYPPPVVINKTLPNNLVTYKQNIAVRYLKPPTPPPPGPLIIREVRPPPPPPLPPIQIRQRPPAPPTPPPIILREQPPALPPHIPAQVVEKVLPPPPPQPRRVVVERYAPCPPKPADVIIERWLPYKKPPERRVIVERAKEPYIPPQEPNLLILHDAPHARIHKHYINQGVVRADPYSYSRQYGSDINIARYSHIVDEATHAVPPPITEIRDHHDRYDNYASYWGDYQRSPSYISSRWESPRREYSIPRSSSYHYYDYSGYDAPYRHYYDDYYSYPRRGSYVTMEDVTSSWGRYCGSSSYDSYPSSYFSRSSYYDSYPSSYRSYSSSYPLETIHVNSENEFHDVLSRLTNGRIPSTDYPY